jgi:hypothetical protein
MRVLAARSVRFYRSLRAHFDLVFNDITDRDAGFYRVIEGNPRTTWDPADFRRHDAYLAAFDRIVRVPIVLWQLPLGNSFLNDTWNHFRDNRVQWWLAGGPGSAARAHLRATERAGVIGLLYGGGADGTTSARTDGGCSTAWPRPTSTTRCRCRELTPRARRRGLYLTSRPPIPDARLGRWRRPTN